MIKLRMKVINEALEKTRVYLRSLATRKDGLRIKNVALRSGVSVSTIRSIMAGRNVEINKVAEVQHAMIRMGIVPRGAVLTMGAWGAPVWYGTRKKK